MVPSRHLEIHTLLYLPPLASPKNLLMEATDTNTETTDSVIDPGTQSHRPFASFPSLHQPQSHNIPDHQIGILAALVLLHPTNRHSLSFIRKLYISVSLARHFGYLHASSSLVLSRPSRVLCSSKCNKSTLNVVMVIPHQYPSRSSINISISILFRNTHSIIPSQTPLPIRFVRRKNLQVRKQKIES